MLQLAQLLKTTLRSDVKVYVEYNNELWNWRSMAVRHQPTATAEVTANPNSTLVYDRTTDTSIMTYRRRVVSAARKSATSSATSWRCRRGDVWCAPSSPAKWCSLTFLK